MSRIIIISSTPLVRRRAATTTGVLIFAEIHKSIDCRVVVEIRGQQERGIKNIVQCNYTYPHAINNI